MEDELEAIKTSLEAIVERLDELAFEALRAASAEGATTRPEIDRRLVRVRRAIERAIGLLRAS